MITMNSPSCFFSLLLLMSSFWITTDAIWLSIPATGTKCVSEELSNKVVVLADYVVVADDNNHHPTISVKVTSPYGNHLYQKESSIQGQFAFTTEEAGNYLACFWMDGPHHGRNNVSVNLDWKTGITAKEWETVAKKEKVEMHFSRLAIKIQGVEQELKKLEGAVEAIHENLLYLKNRESEMRIVNEKTNNRVAWFSIMSLGVCISVSFLQLWHLKRFFQKRKLI
ncbi:Transmembrane emp24 domain-containing protein p24delta3 [Linum perenne]